MSDQPPIDRNIIVEIYNLFDQLHRKVIEAGCSFDSDSSALVAALNEADALADQMERKFALILTPKERNDESDSQNKEHK